MVLRSAQFDDIYFSPDDGLAETIHVFLQGNNLPDAWAGRERFVIAETGFGTGLNFLAAWDLFEKTAGAEQSLHYVSFEKYPLQWAEIEPALAPWAEIFGPKLHRMRDVYPLRVPGYHRIVINARVTLTLIFDDVNDAIPDLDIPCGVDAWFLDGFAPAKNPDMWSEILFSHMARLSAPDARVATFTAAGFVKRGLRDAGFTVSKARGYGRKRDMLVGQIVKEDATSPAAPQRIAIIGAGLAGTAAAYVLKQAGLTPTIFEAGNDIATGASGNDTGLFNPRFSAHRNADSDFFTAAFAQIVRIVRAAPDIDYNPCGSLHLIVDEEKDKQLQGTLKNWHWPEEHMRLVSAAEASTLAGVSVKQSALYLPDAGTLSPRALCHYYAQGVDVRLNHPVNDVDALRKDYDAVIVACGVAAKDFDGLEWLPLSTVRGQITQIEPTEVTRQIKTNLCYGGYIAPARGNIQTLGATFQQWQIDTDVKDEDHQQNIDHLQKILPGPAPHVTGGRTSLRTSSQDRLPVIGKIKDSVYVSTAHGSHGIISSLTAAYVLLDLMVNGPRSLSRASLARLSPERFIQRAQKRQAQVPQGRAS